MPESTQSYATCPGCGRRGRTLGHPNDYMCSACKRSRPDADIPLTGGRWVLRGATYVFERETQRAKPDVRHGTFGGYRRHLRVGTEPCPPCREANREQKRMERTGSPEKQLEPCGTYAAAMRHKSRGEAKCWPCKVAEAEYVREYRARKRAEQRAEREAA